MYMFKSGVQEQYSCKKCWFKVKYKSQYYNYIILIELFCSRLLKACFKLIGHKFQQLHIQGILKQLKYEHLLALLESDIHLPDASEFQIFKVVAEWVGKDIENNKQHLDTLLDWIK